VTWLREEFRKCPPDTDETTMTLCARLGCGTYLPSSYLQMVQVMQRPRYTSRV
jgi:hypothetical protein